MSVPAPDIHWTAFDGPKYYVPGDVPRALEEIAVAEDQPSGKAAYDRLLFAVGNNHAGTLYPAAVAVTPLVMEIARSGTPWARWSAFEVLIELVSFVAEPGFETVRMPDGSTRDTGEAVREAVRADADYVLSTLRNPAEWDEIRANAIDILWILEDHDDALEAILRALPDDAHPSPLLGVRAESVDSVFAKRRRTWLARTS